MLLPTGTVITTLRQELCDVLPLPSGYLMLGRVITGPPVIHT